MAWETRRGAAAFAVLPFGERGLLLRVAVEGPDVDVNGRLHALAGRLRAGFGGRAAAVLVGYASLYLELSGEAAPGGLAPAAELLRREAARLLSGRGGEAALARAAPPSTVVIPVLYGGAHGPDLAEVARLLRRTPEEVVRRHSETRYHAFCLGFAPGFAYLGALPEDLAVPRLPQPRTRVPAGSVAVAGRQTAVYPSESPGGWRILGRTPRLVYRPWEDPPVLIRPGDAVRFEPIGEAEFRRIEEREAAEAAAWETRVREAAERATEAASWALLVREAGLLTTVQDLGRMAWRELGFPLAGALDRGALRMANRRVGNPDGAAGLEVTLRGPALDCRAPGGAPPRRVAVAGADLGAELDGRPLAPGEVGELRPGSRLVFRGRRSGLRAYLAVEGGFDVPVVGGSRATDLRSGIGGLAGRALRPGDLLPLGTPPGDEHAPHAPHAEAPWAGQGARGTGPAPSGARGGVDLVTVRALTGPDGGCLGPSASETFFGTVWRVGPASDRMGMRLLGPALPVSPGREPLSEPIPHGTIQVTGDGTPIVLLADAQTIGGYPKIAVVCEADLDRLAQLAPGARLRFARAKG
ncbi:MAG: 5-oxoprolinase subunit PxpB [Clostridia bacterium]|nr:5-oxoprolinase subunit PxpB [Clostridia bacterium]